MALRWDRKRKRYIVDLRDGSGKRRWKTLPKGTKKQDAVLEHAKVLKEIGQHTYRSAREIPRFGDLARDWLDNKRGDIRQGTYEQYRGHVENHLIPALGGIKVDTITYPVVRRFLNTSTASPATARKILTTLKMRSLTPKPCPQMCLPTSRKCSVRPILSAPASISHRLTGVPGRRR